MSGTLLRRIPVFAGLAVYAFLSLAGMWHHSAAWDETHYLGLGNLILKHERWDAPSATLHPPLSYYLHSLPLLFSDLDESCFDKGLGGVRRGQCLMEKSDPPGDELLFLARLPMVGVGILLGVMIYLWAGKLYGRTGGLLSLWLYCLSPNVLAHSGLITPDLCLSAFGLAAVYGFWRQVRSPSLANLLLSGVALGLTLLSKYSGLLWLPILLCLAVWERVRREPRSSFGGGFMDAGPLLHFGVVAALSMVIVLAGYLFAISHYLSGLEAQNRMVGEGLPAFLNGTVSRHGGWWYYYLFAFLVKLPIPTMILLAIGLAAAAKAAIRGSREVLWLLLPVIGIFAAFSSLTRVNIGIRYILPAFPFFFILAGRASFLWERGRVAGKLLLLLLMFWLAAEIGFIYPHYHSYFNQFVGGPKNGYRFLVDSNLDWGQDLKTLKQYMDENPVRTIKLSYFGTADPRQYGMDYELLQSFAALPPGRAQTPLRKGDMVAVSATNLYPLYVDLGRLSEHLRTLRPVDQVGHSILIYRLEKDLE